ncbi:isochorismate synthase [Timonella sp. A28]|uniref:isochorismate synthase n=1 Tax=Timonella sp. A28 TaxID=3442640 RepID=UPI003EB787F7
MTIEHTSPETHTQADFTFAVGTTKLACHGARHVINGTHDSLIDDITQAFNIEKNEGNPYPIVVGVIPFDPTQQAHLFVPEKIQWDSQDNTPAAPEHTRTAQLVDASADDYVRAVNNALARIKSGALEKVVLSRTVDVITEDTFDVAAIWSRLRRSYPEGFSFSVRTKQGHLIGSSPELVAGSKENMLHVFPLAGSAQRGTTPAEDDAIVANLLASHKDRKEHAIVVDEVVENLARVADDVTVPHTPTVCSTPHLWHLGTSIRASLRPGVSSLEAALALHPTAAVCGRPSHIAASVISELEPHDRGNYAGLIGWMDAHGHGTWALTLRCAEVTGHTARLFAGAGIVTDSDPQKELQETTTKLRTMMDALGVVV